MNTSRKGWKKERECRVLLESEGWKIVFKSIRWRFGTLDFAGLFDTVAVKSSPSGTQWLFISNKHFNGYHLQHQEAIRQFKQYSGQGNMLFQLWIWRKPQWRGRGENKKWHRATWEVIDICS